MFYIFAMIKLYNYVVYTYTQIYEMGLSIRIIFTGGRFCCCRFCLFSFVLFCISTYCYERHPSAMGSCRSFWVIYANASTLLVHNLITLHLQTLIQNIFYRPKLHAVYANQISFPWHLFQIGIFICYYRKVINFLWPRAIWVNICSDKGLLPDGAKPLPESMLTYHQYGPVTFIWEQFHKRSPRYQSLKLAWQIFIKKFMQIAQWPTN